MPGAWEAKVAGNNARLAALARDWVATTLPHAGADLQLQHDLTPLPRLIAQALSYEGGCWCGGMAVTYQRVLAALGIPAMAYNYGHHRARLSHMTTVVMLGERLRGAFLRDVYFGYHYEDGEGHELGFGNLIQLVEQKRYDEIHQVFVRYTRPVVGLAYKTGVAFRWLYDDYNLPAPLVFDDRKVWPGAHVSFDRLFAPGTDNGNQLDMARGDMPREHYLLELLTKDVQTFVPPFDPERIENAAEIRAGMDEKT
jgi:hypothetical protein